MLLDAAKEMANSLRDFVQNPEDKDLRWKAYATLLQYELAEHEDEKHDPRCMGDCGPCGGMGGVPDSGPNGEMALTCLTCGGSGKCPGCSDSYRQAVEENLRRWASEP